MSFKDLENEYGDRLRKQFANIFDVTPNPPGATTSRDAIDERYGAEEIPAAPPASAIVENIALVIGVVGNFVVYLT